MVSGNFDEDDRDAVGSSIHISVRPQGSTAAHENADARRGEAVALAVDIAYLQPDRHRCHRRAWPVPGYLEQSLAEKSTTEGSSGPELAVNRQAQHIAVEPSALAEIGRAQQDTTAQDFQI